MGSRLVVFDIDGTLTRTNEADEACFARAVADHFSIHDAVTDWSAYTHSTDSGIIDELVGRTRGKKPEPEELETYRQVFLKHLKDFSKTVAHSFHPVAGATDLFERMRTKARETFVAIATGGWNISAKFKLQTAGLKTDAIPAAFADDHFSREEIILRAVERSKAQYNKSSFDQIIYVGDGVWASKAARQLGIGFVGIHDNRDPSKLKNAGANEIIRDYSDLELFLKKLEATK